MSLCLPSALAALRDELLALIEDLRKYTPMERLIAIDKETADDRWGIEAIFERLDPQVLSKKPTSRLASICSLMRMPASCCNTT